MNHIYRFQAPAGVITVQLEVSLRRRGKKLLYTPIIVKRYESNVIQSCNEIIKII